MANKFTRTETQLKTLTAQETLQISRAAQQSVTTTEDLIYKYREEFLHIQRAAELGLTRLNILVDNPDEFTTLMTSWGFTATGGVQTRTNTVFRSNLGADTRTEVVSNVTVDWSTPQKPTVDVELYRSSGNLVSLQDSTQLVPLVDQVKARLGVVTDTYTVDKKIQPLRAISNQG